MSVKPTFEHTDSFCFTLKQNFKMLFKRNFFIKNEDWKFTTCVVCVEISWLITGVYFYLQRQSCMSTMLRLLSGA